MELYVSRFLCGLSAGGSFVLVPLFVAEIAEDRLASLADSLILILIQHVFFVSIRGTLGSLMMVSANLGILLAFAVGHYLPYAIVPKVFICLPIVFLLSLFMFPETPHYFMRTNREHVSAGGSSLFFPISSPFILACSSFPFSSSYPFNFPRTFHLPFPPPIPSNFKHSTPDHSPKTTLYDLLPKFSLNSI